MFNFKESLSSPEKRKQCYLKETCCETGCFFLSLKLIQIELIEKELSEQSVDFLKIGGSKTNALALFCI